LFNVYKRFFYSCHVFTFLTFLKFFLNVFTSIVKFLHFLFLSFPIRPIISSLLGTSKKPAVAVRFHEITAERRAIFIGRWTCSGLRLTNIIPIKFVELRELSLVTNLQFYPFRTENRCLHKVRISSASQLVLKMALPLPIRYWLSKHEVRMRRYSNGHCTGSGDSALMADRQQYHAIL